MVKKITTIFGCFIIAAIVLTGCGRNDNQDSPSNGNENDSSTTIETTEEMAPAVSVLEVSFGDEGQPFTMNLDDNDTAAAIARHVGTADWRLPIDHFDDYENWEVMQYYEIPSRYEIPSNPETITSAKAGEVYYSDPNRIVLFYQDGEVTGEYTRIGSFDPTEEFVAAVSENPVLEGWGNKIVLIRTPA